MKQRPWVAVLLLSCLTAVCSASSNKTYFSFTVNSWDGSVSRGRRGLLRNAALPLHGAVKDYGYFYAAMFLGTPPKKFAVIVDTGSTMTYVPCASCGLGCGPNHQSPAFDPEASSTATKIGCGSSKCLCGSPRCSCVKSQCTYSRSYAEQSSSSGVLVEDVLSLHDGEPGAPIIFGCETRETGEIYKQRADGLFGLGNSDVSVINQLVASGVIDNVFSLCFGSVEGEGALLLGDAPLPPSATLRYTPLVTSLAHPFYYNVKLRGLGVGGSLLRVDQALFQQGYGTVLDSGTTFTYLPSLVFKAFAVAVEKHALSHGLFKVPGPDPTYEDICFGGAPEHYEEQGLQGVFPTLELILDQMEPLSLPPLNYLFVHTFNSGKYCLGVFDNGAQGTLLGGITFRNILVQYDRGSQLVGFAHANCRELGRAQRPPCSSLVREGVALDVALEGSDCQPGPSRAQQQEQPQPDPWAGSAGGASDSGSGGGGGGSSQAAASGGAGAGGFPGGTDAIPEPSLAAGGSGESSSQSMGGASGTASSGDGGVQDAGEGGGGEMREQGRHGGSRRAVVVGAVTGMVAGVVVTAAVLAVRSLKRERIRSTLVGLRPYRLLREGGPGPQDPETGPMLGGTRERDEGRGGEGSPEGVEAGSGTGAGSPGSGSSGGGGSAPPFTPLKPIPLVEMGLIAGDKRLGLTSPTKLQRQASATLSAAKGREGGSVSGDDEGAGGAGARGTMLLLQSPPSSSSSASVASLSPSPSRSARALGGLTSGR